ncbi:hypothetical protein IWW39_003258 [Coemansia spiralis]|uniref:rRNA-processing protein FYV7 n=1 Tax=Coemansia spiralis TaxID=417178 RepID=A0A9W8L3T1_9FUNG|nr:hypothetical protein IWW39_003258 [Coemansia spiralis]
MSFPDKSSERRRAPSHPMALGTRIQSSYRGKVIKQRIERNQISKIKRKFFKSVKADADTDASAEVASIPEESSRAEPLSGAAAAASTAKARGDAAGSKAWRSQRSNPFQKLLKERDAARLRNDEERKQREQAISEAEAGRNKYMQQRKSQQKKHTAKNIRGQPALSKQIGGLLQKIKKDK